MKLAKITILVFDTQLKELKIKLISLDSIATQFKFSCTIFLLDLAYSILFWIVKVD
jgi:hypothetical protein